MSKYNLALHAYTFVNTMLEDGTADYDISHRGGYVKVPSGAVFGEFNIPLKYADRVPRYIGAGCNYLGGGVRGEVFSTGNMEDFINHGIPKKYAKILALVGNALILSYERLEGGMNDEEYEDGETNWDAVATNAARRANVRSAY